MSEERFKIDDDWNWVDTLTNEYLTAEDVFHKLNGLHAENERYKNLFFEIVENALTDKNCREMYCEGVLSIFDDCESLDEAREQIKDFLD